MLLFNFRWVMAQQALSKSRSHRGPMYECRSCPVICDKRGMVTHIVSKHMAVREAPFYCTICDCKYVARRDWERHWADAHHQTRCAMRPQLARGCMGSNPDGVPLDGPTARAVALSRDESDRYWALFAAAKDSTLVLESPSESEGEDQREEPADNGPRDQRGADIDHFVFDMPQRQVITPSREVPPMTDDLVGSPRLPANHSPGTEKSGSPSPAHATSVRPVSSDSTQGSTACQGKEAKSVTAACSVANDSTQRSTSHQGQQTKGTTGVCPAPKSTQKTAATSAEEHQATRPSKRKTKSVTPMSPPASLPQETSGAPAPEETRKTSKKEAPTAVVTSDLLETVSSPPCVPKPFERTSHQEAGPSTATQAPPPPSLDTEEWARVYTRMADVVGAAVREGLAAGFEYFGRAMEQQNTLITRSLSDSADVQTAILRSLNPDRSSSTSSREPGTGSRHRSPARRHADEGTRRRRSRTPERKRRRDSRDS